MAIPEKKVVASLNGKTWMAFMLVVSAAALVTMFTSVSKVKQFHEDVIAPDIRRERTEALGNLRSEFEVRSREWASKHDLSATESRLKESLKESDLRLKTDIQATEQRLQGTLDKIDDKLDRLRENR